MGIEQKQESIPYKGDSCDDFRVAAKKYKLCSKVWPYPGMDGWFFLIVDKKRSAELSEKYAKKKRGFGSFPVMATIGKTTWKTSIFPDKQSGTYLLPLKAKVRKAEAIAAEDMVSFTLDIQA